MDHLADFRADRGFPSHISQHVGGMVIASEPLIEWCHCSSRRWKAECSCSGKGLSGRCADGEDRLPGAGHAFRRRRKPRPDRGRYGKQIDLSRIDFEDERVYDSICEADTMVFSRSNPPPRCRRSARAPRTLDDLTVEVAIIRPGPVIGGAVNPYINRRMKREPVTYDHPSLKPVLEETLGVILFQEQVLQVAMALAGFTAGQAESLRRAMSRKRSREAMTKFKEEFIAGSLERCNHENGTVRFQQDQGFSGRLPKSHAAAFGLLAYQTAWLREYYPAESLCALFNAQPMGFYAPHVLVNDGKRHGLDVFPPTSTVALPTAPSKTRPQMTTKDWGDSRLSTLNSQLTRPSVSASATSAPLALNPHARWKKSASATGISVPCSTSSKAHA